MQNASRRDKNCIHSGLCTRFAKSFGCQFPARSLLSSSLAALPPLGYSLKANSRNPGKSEKSGNSGRATNICSHYYLSLSTSDSLCFHSQLFPFYFPRNKITNRLRPRPARSPHHKKCSHESRSPKERGERSPHPLIGEGWITTCSECRNTGIGYKVGPMLRESHLRAPSGRRRASSRNLGTTF